METEETAVDLSKLCRTCNTECLHMNPLFTRDPDIGHGFNDMLMSCTNLNIVKADGFPNSICDDCVDQLKSAYQFKEQCEIVDHYYKRLALKSNSDSTETPTVYDKRPDYDYVNIFKDNSTVFTCQECYRDFDTIRELLNHELMHSKIEIKEEKQEPLRVAELVLFIKEENEEEHYLQLKQEENDEGEDDSSNLFSKQINGKAAKGRTEVVAISTETKQQHGDSLFVAESITFKKEEIKEEKDPLEITKEAYADFDINIKRSSCIDNGDSNYSLSDSDYAPNEAKNRKHLNTHQLLEKLQSPKTKLFASCSNLQVHAHNTHKRFKCGICEKSFVYRSSLHKHERFHCENKCDICGKSYKHSWHLRDHKRTHKANEHYNCAICEKSSSYQNVPEPSGAQAVTVETSECTR